jgi:hypothetical protein
MIPQIKPVMVCAGAMFSYVFMATGLTSAEGDWLVKGVAVLAFLAWFINNTLSAVQKSKSLKHGSITPTPLPVIVEKSLAEKFVDVPKFETFEQYVHRSHHDIKEEVNAVKLEGEERGKQHEQLMRELGRDNEKRSEKIHDRINTVAEEMPRKVIALLRDTGHLRLPNK